MACKVLRGQRGDDRRAGVGTAAETSAAEARSVGAFGEDRRGIRLELPGVFNSCIGNNTEVVGGGLGVKESVAKDGEELLNGVNVNVADEIEGVAPSVGRGSGADALDVPVDMRKKLEYLKLDPGNYLKIAVT